MRPAALVLRCGPCGRALPTLGLDRAWTCAACGVAWETGDDGLVARPFRALPPADGAGVRLPFWRLDFQAEVAADDADARRVVEEVAARGVAWVRAWWLSGAFSIGDPGQALTEAAWFEPDEAPFPRLPSVVGVRITSDEAVRLAEHFVLAEADRIHDVTGVTLRLQVTARALVALPYRLTDEDLVFALDRWSCRRCAVPDLDAIVAAQR